MILREDKRSLSVKSAHTNAYVFLLELLRAGYAALADRHSLQSLQGSTIHKIHKGSAN